MFYLILYGFAVLAGFILGLVVGSKNALKVTALKESVRAIIASDKSGK